MHLVPIYLCYCQYFRIRTVVRDAPMAYARSKNDERCFW